MSDLVRNPEDRFSRDTAYFSDKDVVLHPERTRVMVGTNSCDGRRACISMSLPPVFDVRSYMKKGSDQNQLKSRENIRIKEDGLDCTVPNNKIP